MVTPEILAKLNEVIVLSLTKNRIKVEIMGWLNPIVLYVGYIRLDHSSLHRDGTNNGFPNWIHLERNPNCIEELNDTLEWLHTLEEKGE